MTHLATERLISEAAYNIVVAVSVTTTTATFALPHQARVVETTNAGAVALTIPANTSVAFPVGAVIEVCQVGAGQVTILAASGVTLRTGSSATTRAQWSSIGLRKRATNEWVLSGDLT